MVIGLLCSSNELVIYTSTSGSSWVCYLLLRCWHSLIAEWQTSCDGLLYTVGCDTDLKNTFLDAVVLCLFELPLSFVVVDSSSANPSFMHLKKKKSQKSLEDEDGCTKNWLK